MRAEGVVRLDRLGHEVRPLPFLARVFILSEVRVRPAVECPLPYAGQKVGDQLVSQVVALVDDRPQDIGLRFPIHTNGIAQAAGKNTHPAAVGVRLQNRCAPRVFGVQPVFIHVAPGADADVELAAGGIRDDVARVMAAIGQIH